MALFITWNVTAQFLVATTFAEPTDGRGVTLLVQGTGPIPDSKAAETAWGECEVGPDGRLRWTGFAGYLVNEHGWRIGGVFRSEGERVLPNHLDDFGAYQDGPADVYILASSIPAQQDGLPSRAKELATAVQTLRAMMGAGQLRCICYSASGVAARLWMQGAIDDLPYTDGSVSHLVTVGSPHSGLAGLVRSVSSIWDHYTPLATDSDLLRRINHDLDLPHGSRYTAIVIQGPGTALADSGRAFRPMLRFPREQLEALPPLLRLGNDGLVHTLSAQLHLTPTAARYENRMDRPVELIVCRPRPADVADITDVMLHTRALRDPSVWRTLVSTIEPGHDRGRLRSERQLHKRRLWATEIALHMAEMHVQRKHITGRIRSSTMEQMDCRISGQDRIRFTWRCRCGIEIPHIFRNPDEKSYGVTGCCELGFDRFDRPVRLLELALDAELR
jgi:hypothetical protein